MRPDQVGVVRRGFGKGVVSVKWKTGTAPKLVCRGSYDRIQRTNQLWKRAIQALREQSSLVMGYLYAIPRAWIPFRPPQVMKATIKLDLIQNDEWNLEVCVLGC